jgi:hypothetical protein
VISYLNIPHHRQHSSTIFTFKSFSFVHQMATKASATYSAMSPSSPSSGEYKISEESGQSEDSIALLPQDDDRSFHYLHQLRTKKQRLARLLLCSVPWLLSIIFASLSLALYLNIKDFTCPNQHESQQSTICRCHGADSSSPHESTTPDGSHSGHFGSYETGFSTDLGMIPPPNRCLPFV